MFFAIKHLQFTYSLVCSKDTDAKPILPEEAVIIPPELLRQLDDLGLGADLQVFLQQKSLKADARKLKAERQIASAPDYKKSISQAKPM